jgi:uncharacterized protein (DUF58 family)
MNAAADIAPTSAGWDGPDARETRRPLTWQRLVWRLVFPRRSHRISLTLPGVFLVVLALGIGSAAYNTASNILFITLSLLLACLLLSGLLSWFNFRGMTWRLRPPAAWRAGHETLVTLEVQNAKRWLPTYSLWFELATRPRRIPDPPATARQPKLREILASAEQHYTRGRVALHDRVEPRGTVTLEWGVKPPRRGETFVELTAVGSLFPFGFLKKYLGSELRYPVLVWPAQVEYVWSGAEAAPAGAGSRTARAGTGDDLFALRRYNLGDSHRLIHWKASARLGQLMVRQFAAESHEGYVVHLDAAATLWPRPDQFELACSLAGTLAEDLFAAGRLRGIIRQDGGYVETRRLRDVEAFLDELARLDPFKVEPDLRAGSIPARPEAGLHHNRITFAPDGARGVAAYVDGRKTASA